MWREQDQGLLDRLEDEALLGRLWRFEAPGAGPLHPRAAGLLSSLRRFDAAAEALGLARGGDLTALVGFLRPTTMVGAPAPLIHHLAVYNARLAAVPTVAPSVVASAQLCSLAAWIALAEDKDYLRSFATAVLDDDSVADAATEDAVCRPIDALAEAAMGGARETSVASRQALRTLARVSDACRVGGASTTLRDKLEKRAERHRVRVIEAALAPISEALNDATARGKAEVEGAALMQRVADVWGWADGDEHVERFAIDVVTPIAWNVYHEENSDRALRALLSPLNLLVDRIAWRIESDGTRIAYAGPTAQMYVFRSELAHGPEQLRWAERSLEICPTHRNGRLILASLLVHDVRDRLDRSSMFMQGSDFYELSKTLERAEELYPRTRGLDALKEKVKEARERSWWSR